MDSNKFFNEEYTTFAEIFIFFLKLKNDKDARDFFNKYVEALSDYNHISKEKALECGKKNFGYYAGYFSIETQERVQHLLDCEHPIFGKVEDYKDKDADFFFNKGVEQAINRVYETNR